MTRRQKMETKRKWNNFSHRESVYIYTKRQRGLAIWIDENVDNLFFRDFFFFLLRNYVTQSDTPYQSWERRTSTSLAICTFGSNQMFSFNEINEIKKNKKWYSIYLIGRWLNSLGKFQTNNFTNSIRLFTRSHTQFSSVRVDEKKKWISFDQMITANDNEKKNEEK